MQPQREKLPIQKKPRAQIVENSKNSSTEDPQTTEPTSINPLTKPQITQQPRELYFQLHETSQFSIQVAGHPTPTIKWYKDGKVLPNEVSPTLSIKNVQWVHRGNYWAIASNSQGHAQTKVIRLRLKTKNKWDSLFTGQIPPSSIELGTIDRDLGMQDERSL